MKRNIFKNLMCMGVVLLMLLSVIACNKQNNDPIIDTSTEEQDTSFASDQKKLPVYENNSYAIKLIYGTDSRFFEKDLCINLGALLEELTGVELRLESDTKANADHAYNGPAILVGETSFEESKEIYRSIQEQDASATLIGNKLVLACGSEDAASVLLAHLKECLAKHATAEEIYISEEWTTTLDITFDADGNKTFDESGLINAAPLPTDLLGRSFAAGQGSAVYLRSGATRASFDAICKALEIAGMSRYTTNAIGNNLFATYITKTQIAHVMYLPNNQEVRTSVDRRGEGIDGFALTGLSGENSYTDLCDSNLTLVEIENADWPGGLCMIFKLSDGRFFVIDSGIGGRDNDGSSSGWIWASLAKHAEDPNDIRIAAWLITHPHSDHAGGLLDMARGWYETSSGKHTVMPKNLTEIIKIERLIYNQPENMEKFGRGGWINEIITAFDIKNVIKAHPGQEIWLANLKLTVYTTQDLLLEQDSNIDDLNEYSVVTMLEFNGKRILALGDADPISNSISAKLYQNELKADVIQVSHHGYGDTGAGQVNQLCNPDIVLWPVGKEEMVSAGCKQKEINRIFLDKENHAPHGGNITFDQHWICSLTPNADLLAMLPICDCGCGKKSSFAT